MAQFISNLDYVKGLSDKHEILFRKWDIRYDPYTIEYELYLLTADFTPIHCRAISPERCFTIIDEHLTYWKQHGVHPNV